MIQRCAQNKKSATSVLEFLVVFVILYVFFMATIDIGLFFRQVYLVQTMADETLSRLQTEHVCSDDLGRTSLIMQKAIGAYYDNLPEIVYSDGGGFYKFTGNGDKYIFSLSCRTPDTPDTLLFAYKYEGIFLFRRGKYIYSNYSANTLFF